MNRRLADAVDLQMQMKQAHWNVKGPHFIGLHEQFDKTQAAEAYVDFLRNALFNSAALRRAPVRSRALRLKSIPSLPKVTRVEAVSVGCPLSDVKSAKPLMRRTSCRMLTPRIYSRKSRVA